LETALWSAVVALEERVDLLRRLQADGKGHADQRCSQEIAEIELQAAQLRALITNMLSAGIAVESA
jgi:hypothetical protein